MSARIAAAKTRLDRRGRRPRAAAPRVAAAFETAAAAATTIPDELRLTPGGSTTLRAELARCLHLLNRESGGAFLTAAADLLGSTSVSSIAEGFPAGLWNAETNPEARLLSIGGICEDAISGVLSGISSYGHHIGVGASYGAFLAPLSHIAARLHAIGAQAREAVSGDPYDPMILVCGHAGLKTGEDGPTHADPQPLQLLQENFPAGTAISLTPWEPQEIWPLVATALARRPALISAFVTRPNETVLDRVALGLAPAEAAAAGVYVLRRPEGEPDVTVVLQESAVTYAFVEGALPLLAEKGVDALVYYVASAELFDLLPEDERRARLPRGARRRGDRHHRLHPADALPLGALRRGAGGEPAPLPPRPLPGQRAGSCGARRGGPRRREPGARDPRVRRAAYARRRKVARRRRTGAKRTFTAELGRDDGDGRPYPGHGRPSPIARHAATPPRDPRRALRCTDDAPSAATLVLLQRPADRGSQARRALRELLGPVHREAEPQAVVVAGHREVRGRRRTTPRPPRRRA